jgi:hypothetical protein
MLAIQDPNPHRCPNTSCCATSHLQKNNYSVGHLLGRALWLKFCILTLERVVLPWKTSFQLDFTTLQRDRLVDEDSMRWLIAIRYRTRMSTELGRKSKQNIEHLRPFE